MPRVAERSRSRPGLARGERLRPEAHVTTLVAWSRLPSAQSAVRKIESRQVELPRELCPGRLPVKPAGDHQVQHEPEFVVESNQQSASPDDEVLELSFP